MSSVPQMRKSRVLEKVRAGETAVTCKLNLSCPRAVEIAAMAGFDCVWLDMEHVPNSWSAVESQIYAAKAGGVDSLVRVSRGSYSDYIKPLEMDATGIMVPHIMSAADARHVARITRFHPIGLRPVDGGNSDGAYCRIPVADYFKQANENRFVVVQIEDLEPLDELDEICSVEGIDMIFFGPGDFTQSLGVPGKYDHPRVADTRKLVAERARAHGKFAGTVCSLDSFEDTVSLGYSLVNVGADVLALSNTFDEVIARTSGIATTSPKAEYQGGGR